MSKQEQPKLGPIARRKQAINDYIEIRKLRMKQERDYFASEGESDPARLEAQKERDREFLRSLKKWGVGFIVFIVFYALLKTILGLW